MRREFPVPPGHLEQARAWLDRGVVGGQAAAVPRPAVTVLLVREGEDGLEVFLMRRARSMRFAGGMHAFPGGGVDPRDAGDDVPWVGPGVEVWGELLRAAPAQARALVCAAVRETFEECGVLLAGAGADSVVGDTADPLWEVDRRRLLDGETAVSALLRERALVLRADLLRPWAHWTTPVHEPCRYDTRFLLAALPPGQRARHVGGESEESGWWSPSRAVAAAERGRIDLLPPTLVALEELAALPDVAAAFSAPRRVREVVPVLERRGSGCVLVADLPEQV